MGGRRLPLLLAALLLLLLLPLLQRCDAGGGFLSVFARHCDYELVGSLLAWNLGASSRSSIFRAATFARLYGLGGWSPDYRDQHPWLQIDLTRRCHIKAIATQGTFNSYNWVTRYIVLYGDHPNNWKPYFQQGGNWTFFGNVNESGVVRHELHHPILARYIRIIPVAWNPHGTIGLRVGLYGCYYKSDILYFDGDDSIAYQFRVPTVRTAQDLIGFNFKSLQKDGLLMHTEGIQGDYISVELRQARLIVSISLGNSSLNTSGGETTMTLGSLLDDQHWHQFQLERYRQFVNLSLDGEVLQVRLNGAFEQLDLDKEVFFGGVKNHEKQRLPYRQNFHGCMENIAFNLAYVSDLARRKKPSVRVEGHLGTFCRENPLFPFTFAGVNNFLQVKGYPRRNTLSIKFGFRTWDVVGLLFYTPFSDNLGWLEMVLSDGQINVTIAQPRTKIKKLEFAAGYRLNDGFWHSVALTVRETSAVITIDDQSDASFRVERDIMLRTGEQYFFGGCPKPASKTGCLSNQTAFHGCMRMVYVDKQPIELDMIRMDRIGKYFEVYFNVCGIIDRCTPSMCEHGGRCIQSWDDFTCICDLTGYKGETCHKPVYKETCESYRLSGKVSGNYTIDPDGSGPLKPFMVYCDMRADRAWTVVRHNRLWATQVKGYSPENPFLGTVDYWNASWGEVSALANASEYCEQRIEFRCYLSRLLNTQTGMPLSFWMGRNGERHYYWGGSPPGLGRCACGMDKNCVDSRFYCNCDADQYFWRSDWGMLTFVDHLPVTQVVVTDTNRTGSEAQFLVGPLRCYGDRNSWNGVTFTRGGGLLFPSFKVNFSLDVSFFFKTSAPSGTFLENVGNMSYVRFDRNFIRMELNTSRDVVFAYNIGNGDENLTVHSQVPFNDNEWHEVKGEINVKLARLRVDRLPWVVRAAPPQSFVHLNFSNNSLFVGCGEYYLRPFVGCLRGLRMNGLALNLEGKANVTEGVLVNCTGHCRKPLVPCLNHGTCTEHYNHYTCNCSVSAFEGPFCNQDIGAYFELGTWVRYDIMSTSLYAVQQFTNIYSQPFQPLPGYNLTGEEVDLGFRTSSAPAVLLYVSTFVNDYVTILIREDGILQLRYQLGTSPYIFPLSTYSVADGQPHRVNVTRVNRTLYIQLDYFPVQVHRFSPFVDSKLDSPKRLYLGRFMETGAIDPEIQRFNTPGFVGCLSGVKFNSIVPFKTIFRRSSKGPTSPYQITGRLVESKCGSMPAMFMQVPPELDPWYTEPVEFQYIHDDGLVAIILGVLFFLLLLLAAALLMMYLHHHRYKGSYHTNEPKATQDYNRGGGGEGEGRSAEPVATPAAKPVAPRKDPNLPQILEESKTE